MHVTFMNVTVDFDCRYLEEKSEGMGTITRGLEFNYENATSVIGLCREEGFLYLDILGHMKISREYARKRMRCPASFRKCENYFFFFMIIYFENK